MTWTQLYMMRLTWHLTWFIWRRTRLRVYSAIGFSEYIVDVFGYLRLFTAISIYNLVVDPAQTKKKKTTLATKTRTRKKTSPVIHKTISVQRWIVTGRWLKSYFHALASDYITLTGWLSASRHKQTVEKLLPWPAIRLYHADRLAEKKSSMSPKISFTQAARWIKKYCVCVCVCVWVYTRFMWLRYTEKSVDGIIWCSRAQFTL